MKTSTRNPIKCTKCDFVTGRTGMNEKITEHYGTTHGITDPIEVYVDTKCGGARPICKCGCGKYVRWYGWARGFEREYVNGHGVPWKGKTKDTDPRLAAMGKKVSKTRKKLMDAGEITIWSKGKTKETDERVAAMSEMFKEQYASGERNAWHKGLTEETDERVAKWAQQQRDDFASGKRQAWSKGKTKETEPRLITWANSRDMERHRNLIRIPWSQISESLSKLKNLTFVGSETDYVAACYATLLMRCNSCGNEKLRDYVGLLNDRCDICSPLISKGETEWLDSLSIPPECRNRWVHVEGRRFNVDGLINSTIYEYYGDYWHGNPKTQAPDKINHMSCAPMSQHLQYTLDRESILRDAGYVVVTMWESDWMNLRKSRPH